MEKTRKEFSCGHLQAGYDLMTYFAFDFDWYEIVIAVVKKNNVVSNFYNLTWNQSSANQNVFLYLRLVNLYASIYYFTATRWLSSLFGFPKHSFLIQTYIFLIWYMNSWQSTDEKSRNAIAKLRWFYYNSLIFSFIWHWQMTVTLFDIDSNITDNN